MMPTSEEIKQLKSELAGRHATKWHNWTREELRQRRVWPIAWISIEFFITFWMMLAALSEPWGILLFLLGLAFGAFLFIILRHDIANYNKALRLLDEHNVDSLDDLPRE